MNSPHGRRGAICAHFGWTYQYLTEGIAWALVEKMMLDAPSYDAGSGKDEKDMELTNENADQLADYINSMI